MATASGGFIRYQTQFGDDLVAEYSTLSAAQTDATAMNTAAAAGTKIVINGNLVSEVQKTFVAVAATITTPS
jgi:hypothetical protein